MRLSPGLIADDVHYGARSLQHAVDQRVINNIAQAHEQGLLQPGGSVRIVVDHDDIALQTKAPPNVPGGSSASWWSG